MILPSRTKFVGQKIGIFDVSVRKRFDFDCVLALGVSAIGKLGLKKWCKACHLSL